MSFMDHRIELGDAGQVAALGGERTGAAARGERTELARLARWLLAALAVTLATVLPTTARAQGEPAEAAPAEAADAGYYEDTDPTAVTEFRDTLAPHGQWVEDPVYGVVWVPNTVVVGPDFRPYYTAGRWAVADDGSWVWVSDYDWGYIPFHYGRWVWISGRGWAWIPGRRYAPAWVVWRVGEPGWDYVGWAPMGPSFIWVDGVAVAYWHVGVLPFWFVASPWLFHHHWHYHVVPPHRHHHVAAHTHVHGGSGRHPASPTSGPAGGDDRHGASPTSGGRTGIGAPTRHAVGAGLPTSPSFDEARIPPGARPKDRVTVDSRASSLARPSPQKPATARRSPAGGGSHALGTRSSDASSRPRQPGARNPAAGRSGVGPGWSAPRRSPSAASDRARGGWQAPSRSTPSSRAWSPPQSNRSYGTPAPRSGSSSGWQPPSRSGSPTTKSTPSRSSGSSSWGRSPSRSSAGPSVHAPSHSSRSSSPAASSSKRSSSSKKASSGSRSSGKSRSRRR